jgi:hypothetical protein
MMYDGSATPFAVEELLFGFSRARRQRIPHVIIWMLQVVKHYLWVARNDFRFRDKRRTEADCLKAIIARLKFLLKVLAVVLLLKFGRLRSSGWQIKLSGTLRVRSWSSLFNFLPKLASLVVVL